MSSDTICALATASGGAIAVIRVSGPKAIEITNAIVIKDISKAKSATLHYTELTDNVDYVLISVFRAPHSYTGEDTTEISSHGGYYITQQILSMLQEHGARMALPGEFTQRSFMNGKMDLSQAESVADLIAATNKATHNMAMSQLRGNFRKDLEDLRQKLLKLTSLLELELDFSDQDITFTDREQVLQTAQVILKQINQLRQSFKVGNAIKNGISVAIIGAPNVGKSKLLNTFLHEEKAIVSNIKGTTRDTIEDVVQIHGTTFRFIDTAGIRKTKDQIEKMGIERSLQAAERADIIILLTDKDNQFPDVRIPEGKPVLKVVNKCDMTLPSASFLYHKMPTDNIYHISAITGDGMERLTEGLVRAAAIPEINENDTIVTNVRHFQALNKAHGSLMRAIKSIRQEVPNDLVAQDLRECLHHLGEITGGTITSDEVLQNIFRNFCVGK
ncbi:MAG: tRNA uridine-5-carboxymethylaminomethyl(34) synthesis GTPase MnmE [Bacteroidaceae bacterium]|nr:tRNA uridine-5-carboxymethylaminomethyl(34) synthesis GTPase MnmE [Bacteroidaceae bacterium]